MQRYIATGNFAVVITHNRFTLIDRSAEPLFAALWDELDLLAAPREHWLN